MKLLPTNSRGERWLFTILKTRSRACCSTISNENYRQILLHLGTNAVVHAVQQQMIDDVSVSPFTSCDRMSGLKLMRCNAQDVERTFHKMQLAAQQSGRRSDPSLPTGKGRRHSIKAEFSAADFKAWKATVHQLLSVFLYLKPQIGYCQGMTHLAATVAYESKFHCETAFRVFLVLTERFQLDRLYGPAMPDMNLRYFQVRLGYLLVGALVFLIDVNLGEQLDELLHEHLPRAHMHLSDRGVHPTTYASR